MVKFGNFGEKKKQEQQFKIEMTKSIHYFSQLPKNKSTHQKRHQKFSF